MTGLNENVLNEFYCYTINYTLQGIVRVKHLKNEFQNFCSFYAKKLLLIPYLMFPIVCNK